MEIHYFLREITFQLLCLSVYDAHSHNILPIFLFSCPNSKFKSSLHFQFAFCWSQKQYSNLYSFDLASKKGMAMFYFIGFITLLRETFFDSYNSRLKYLSRTTFRSTRDIDYSQTSLHIFESIHKLPNFFPLLSLNIHLFLALSLREAF